MTATKELISGNGPGNERKKPVSIAWKQDGFTSFDFANGTALTTQTNQAIILEAIVSSHLPPTDEDLRALLNIKPGADPNKTLKSAIHGLQEKLDTYETDCSLRTTTYNVGDTTRVGWEIRRWEQEPEELDGPTINGHPSASDALREFVSSRVAALQPTIPRVSNKPAVGHSPSSTHQNGLHPDTQGVKPGPSAAPTQRPPEITPTKRGRETKKKEAFTALPHGDEIAAEGTKMRTLYEKIIQDNKATPQTGEQLLEALYGEKIRGGELSRENAYSNLNNLIMYFRGRFDPRNLHLVSIGNRTALRYTLFIGTNQEAKEFAQGFRKQKALKQPTSTSAGLRMQETSLPPTEEVDEEPEVNDEEMIRRDLDELSDMESLRPATPVYMGEVQTNDSWEEHERSIKRAERELESGIETGVSPTKREVTINNKPVSFLQGDFIVYELMHAGLTKTEIIERRFSHFPPDMASREVDHAFSRIATEIRWADAYLVSERREDNETAFRLTSEKPGSPKNAETSSPTLADRLGLKVTSRIVVNSARDLTEFDIKQDGKEFRIILGKWESGIFKAYLAFTRIPTLDELVASLPQDESFLMHLDNLNKTLEQKLLISLVVNTRIIDGKYKRVVVPEKAQPKTRHIPPPLAVAEPEPAPLIPRPKLLIKPLFRSENEEEILAIKDVVAHIKRADSADPRRYEQDKRIPMRTLESLYPSEANALRALAGTSGVNTLPASGWATGSSAMQLMEQINPSIHKEGLRIYRNPNGGYYLYDFLGVLRPKTV